jgi:hypothetical protein
MVILRLALSDPANAARSAVYPTCNDWHTSVKRVPCQNHESHTHRELKSRYQRIAGKLRFYEILYTLDQGFEQVLGLLQELENLGVGR